MPLRILIVEDEAVIALELEDIVERLGHTVVGSAATARRALQIAGSSGPIDLAIMDVALAGAQNGIEAAQRLREDHSIPCLFVSAQGDAFTRAAANEWQPLGFLDKPFDRTDIEVILNSYPGR
ncbi:response regulator [Aureimonas sp. AU4]|uniref:response regulator n=1 Tax=Aureimonas sp. AU4 TaxID=1638163 RepID=UPI000780C306|nr:response regulator [Aureimonas sp. AU4]